MTEAALHPSRSMRPFAIAALLWALTGVLICRNTEWFLGLWALSLFNLLALARAVKEILALVATTENREGCAIRAFYWGTLKLICLGIFAAVLFRHRDASFMGRLLGAGTLFVVPLVGGLGAVRHA